MAEHAPPWAADERYEVDGKTYTVHPVAQMFPLIHGTEFTLLVNDVRAHGLRRPILVTGPDASVIVDGRNRVRAALEAGVRPAFAPLDADADPLGAIVSENVRRRQLGQGQFALIGALMRKGFGLVHSTPDRDQVRLPFGDPATIDAPGGAVEAGAEVGARAVSARERRLTQDEVARRLGISVGYVRKAERLLESAPDLAVQAWRGDRHLKDAFEAWNRRRAVDDAPAVAATATRAATGGRAGTERLSSSTSASAASTSGGNGSVETVAVPGDERASRPAPIPSVDASPLPSPLVSATETPASGRSSPVSSPSVLLAGVRLTLGDIDCCPCSTEAEQEHIGAGEWYSAAQDGLSRSWQGVVYATPPPDRVAEFARKLRAEIAAGTVTRAALLGPADLHSEWALQLLESPTHGALVVERDSEPVGDRDPAVQRRALFLLGADVRRAAEVFHPWGVTLLVSRPDATPGDGATTPRAAIGGSSPPTDGASPTLTANDGAVVRSPAGVATASSQSADRVPPARERPALHSEAETSGARRGDRGSAAVGSGAASRLFRSARARVASTTKQSRDEK